MKKKDLVVLVISILVVFTSVYLLYTMLVPKKKVAEETNNTKKTETFTGNIDNETLETIKQLKDYGEGNLDNIGRSNPFAPIN